MQGADLRIQGPNSSIIVLETLELAACFLTIVLYPVAYRSEQMHVMRPRQTHHTCDCAARYRVAMPSISYLRQSVQSLKLGYHCRPTMMRANKPRVVPIPTALA